jgi:predicted dehydrogenase
MYTFGIIGAGAGVFRHHREALSNLPGQIVALADIKPDPTQQRADELGCPFYLDYHQMLAEQQPKVAVILTPPFLHASIAIDCLQAGCHVLVEKPMALHVGEADAMITAAKRADRRLVVVFQHRFDTEILTAKSMLEREILGEVQYVEMRALWPRPASYYQAVPWRATWRGEGGGVLMNQAPHDLDLLCFLFGLPERVIGRTSRLLHRTLETEDTAQALLQWSNGMVGSLFVSTGAGGQSQIAIVGTAGMLTLNGPSAVQRHPPTYAPLSADMHTFVSYPLPQPLPRPLPPSTFEIGRSGTHLQVYRALCRALDGGNVEEEELVLGVQGRWSLELAQAILHSAHTGGEPVSLPLPSTIPPVRIPSFLSLSPT